MKNLPKILLLPASVALLLTSSTAFSAGSFTARPAPQKSTGYIMEIRYYIGRTHRGTGVRDCNNNFSMEWGSETSESVESIRAVCTVKPPNQRPNRFKAK